MKGWRFRRDESISSSGSEMILEFEFVLAGAASGHPNEEFSLEFPNRARVTAEPPCPPHRPCPKEVIAAPPLGGGPRLVGMRYPPLAVSARIHGTVELSCKVSETTNMVPSCQPESGHPLLTIAALECVRLWRFGLNFPVRLVFRFGLTDRIVHQHARTYFAFELPNLVEITSDQLHLQP